MTTHEGESVARTAALASDLPSRPRPGAHDGATFVDSLADGREVWVEGKRVDVTAHPDFQPMLRTLAGLYDRQRSPELAHEMTFKSDLSGNPVSLSYLARPRPRTWTASG